MHIDCCTPAAGSARQSAGTYPQGRRPGRAAAHSRFDYLEAGLTGTLSTPYSRRKAKELEHAFRNGDISYEDACLEMEQLEGEP